MEPAATAAADEATPGGFVALGGRSGALVEVRNLRKEYAIGRGRLVLFESINFQVAKAADAGHRRPVGRGKEYPAAHPGGP